MENNPISISKVSVDGLHNQFDVELDLLPGLNVIYGKNGRGKTTFLHLIANLLELDFERFKHLQFDKIVVESSIGCKVELEKLDPIDSPKVKLNGKYTSFSGTNDTLSDAEKAGLRSALGLSPSYLPAFRSILERARTDSRAYYRGALPKKEMEIEFIIQSEINEITSNNQNINSKNLVSKKITYEEATNTAEKTLLCRQWFGEFVPKIRYPSVADVDDALTDEWRRAAVLVSNREQRMFEDTFVDIFSLIANSATINSDESEDDLRNSIQKLLEEPESQIDGDTHRQIFGPMLQAGFPTKDSSDSWSDLQKSVAQVYRRVLMERNRERRDAFLKSREFETSINKFLEHKYLKIGKSGLNRSRSMVAIETDSGQSCGLSALSSGERQILTMLYSASRLRNSAGIFLIDEPEISLHIDWQRIILSEMTNLSPNRQIIACTHSPEVGAEHYGAFQDFSPKTSHNAHNFNFVEEQI